MIEEGIFYPACKQAIEDPEKLDQGYVKHDGAKVLISEAEQGGPALAGAPSTRGFGHVLCRVSVEGQLGGEVAYDWRPAGLVVSIRMPVAAVSLDR